MKFEVSNSIRVEDPSVDMLNWAKQNLMLSNPEYHKKVQLGKWTGGTPEFIQLYERDGSVLILPFGCLNDVWQRFGKACPFERQFCDLRHVSYQSHISLYPYQETAVNEALTRRNGILVMPCGAGKTQSGIEIISRIGGKALWLTHTQDLLNQSMNRAKAVLDIDQKSYGTITGGKVNIGSGITFATVQTMARLDMQKYRDCWDVIVVDECHKAIGSPTKVMQFYKVISSLNCRYKFGLTATPKRADGLEKSMFALIGGIIHEVDRQAVKDTTCPVRVVVKETEYFPDMDIVLAGDGTLNYAALVDDLTHNEDRLELVAQSIPRDQPTIVLANRVEYLQRLQKRYDELHGGFEPSICLSSLGNSVSAKRLRKNSLIALGDGDIDCIFATYQLAKEGLDVPNLRYVVFATPEKDETTVMQAAGRVGRKADGKEYGTIIDFVDDFAMFRGWAKKRKGYYKKLEYEMED